MNRTPEDLRIAGSRTGPDPTWPDSRVEAWTWGFVAIGIVLRLARYALHHPLWGDEAFLAANLIDRDFAGLARPLDYVQVCPILFLWAEKVAVLGLGFSEWSLRLIPTAASIASLVLFRHVARRLLAGPAAMLAVAILAIGYYPIRYGGEIKPYSVDFLAALGLIALAVEWLRGPGRDRWLWGLAVAGPVCVASSHPSIFVAAGVGLTLTIPALRTRRWMAIGALATFAATTLGLFAVLLRLVTASQSASVMGIMRDYWDAGFPPRAAGPFLGWLARVHSSHMLAYPAGGDRGASTLTTALVLTAILAFGRRGSRTVLALLLAPFAMGLIAAFAGRYPYGGSPRTMQYVAPAIHLMAGLGAAAWLSRIPRPRATGAVAILLASAGLGLLAWDVTHPYKSLPDRECRDFARKFWAETADGAEVACARDVMGVPLDPLNWRSDRSALYLCYREIYGPGRRGPRLDRVREDRPLRVVVFGERPSDRPAVATWLAEMDGPYRLRSRSERLVNLQLNHRTRLDEDFYAVYEFVPRPVPATGRTRCERAIAESSP